MASYVESARLTVEDGATKPIAKINAALDALFQKASQFGSKRIDLGIRATGLDQIESRLGRIEGLMRRAFSAPNIGANVASQLSQITTAANQAQTALQRLNATANAPARRRTDNGWFGRFPENVPGIAARYAGWKSVQYAHTAARVGGDGILEGASERTAQVMQGLSAEQIAMLRGESARIGAEYRNLSIAGIAELGRAAIPNLKDPTKAAGVMEEMARNAAAFAIVYRSGEKGIEAARQAYRGADMAGRADEPEKLKEWLDQTAKATVIAGRDINPMMLAQTVANLGWLKHSISGDAIGDLAMLSDEARGRTADYLRTYANDLTRSNLAKNNKAAMEAAGLRVAGGGASDQLVTYKTRTGEMRTVSGAQLLGEDPFEHAIQVMKPRLERMGVNFAEKNEAVLAKSINAGLMRMGFHPASARFPLWALMKEDENRRGRSKRANVNTSAEFVKDLPFTDLKSGLEAVKQKWKDSADRVSDAIYAQWGGSKLFGGVSGLFSGIAQNPTAMGTGLFAAGSAAAWAAMNAPTVALGLAAARQGFAANQLIGAAAALRAAAMGVPLQKAAALGMLPVAGAAGGWRGVASSGLKYGGVALAGLAMMDGLSQMGGGKFGSGLLTAGLAAGSLLSGPIGWAALAGTMLTGLDQAFNSGRVTSALVGWLDKASPIAKAEASPAQKQADEKNQLLNRKLLPQLEKLQTMQRERENLEYRIESTRHEGRRAELRRELKKLDAQIVAEHREAEVQAKRERMLQNNVIDAGNYPDSRWSRQKQPGTSVPVVPAQPGNIDDRTPAGVAATTAAKADALYQAELAVDRLKALTDAFVREQVTGHALAKRIAAERAKGEEPTAGTWYDPQFTGPPPPSLMERIWRWIIPDAKASDRPTDYSDLNTANLSGDVRTAAETAASPIMAAATTLETSMQSGGEYAGQTILAALQQGAGSVAEAISGALSQGVHVIGGTAADHPERPLNLGGHGGLTVAR